MIGRHNGRQHLLPVMPSQRRGKAQDSSALGLGFRVLGFRGLGFRVLGFRVLGFRGLGV